jgi:hypothetical protein
MARTMDPLRELAERARLKCYRDACGDYNVPGRIGEIFWFGAAHDGLPDRIAVQIGGPRADNAPTKVSEQGGNIRINRLIAEWDVPNQRGSGEAVFILPASRLAEAARAIQAKRRRTMSPEQREKAVERLARFQKRPGKG